MVQLDTDQLYTSTKLDVDGHLTHLFFAFQDAVKLYKAYAEVFLLDCMYKTNKLCCGNNWNMKRELRLVEKLSREPRGQSHIISALLALKAGCPPRPLHIVFSTPRYY